MKKYKECQNCEDDEAELYEFVGSVCCEDCWLEYFRDNELYFNQSFEDFKMGLKKYRKSKEKE